jgi:hypothetical protein
VFEYKRKVGIIDMKRNTLLLEFLTVIIMLVGASFIVEGWATTALGLLIGFLYGGMYMIRNNK